MCHSVQNYEAEWYRDLVPRFDISGRRKYLHTIEVVPSHPMAPLHDHSFSSPTFEVYIQREITNYYRMMRK